MRRSPFDPVRPRVSHVRRFTRRAARAWIKWLPLTLTLSFASLFVCREVSNHAEMADVRLGLPIPFVSANLQRYTPVFYPECFDIGSPFEDPMRLRLGPLLVNLSVLTLGIVLIEKARARWHRG